MNLVSFYALKGQWKALKRFAGVTYVLNNSKQAIGCYVIETEVQFKRF